MMDGQLFTWEALSAMGGASLLYARHGRHLYGESPEWGLASAYH